MDALIEAPAKPKRITWANRMRKKVAYLSGDITALERLVGTLLGHLERATQPDFTDQECVRIRAMVNDIRAALAEGEAEERAA
jgi:hypothetical protein